MGASQAPAIEGRSWQGLHRHALMTMLAAVFTPQSVTPRLWVRRRHSGTFKQCPLYLQKQTFIAAIGMSALGHFQT